MLLAEELDVGEAQIASLPEREVVVKLEPVPLATTATLPVDEAAAALVALVDRPAERCGYVARSGRDDGVGERLAGGLGLPEAPGFQSLQLFGDGSLDDRGQVAVGKLRAHQGPEPFERVAQLPGWP